MIAMTTQETKATAQLRTTRDRCAELEKVMHRRVALPFRKDRLSAGALPSRRCTRDTSSLHRYADRHGTNMCFLSPSTTADVALASRHPASVIHHDPLDRGDEGSRMIPEGVKDHPSDAAPLSPLTPPPVTKKDDGCRIVSSSELLQQSLGSLGGSAAELWGLHLRTGVVTLFVGEASVGKTVFLHNLAYHLASGQEFLEIAPPRPLRVLDVDFESYDQIYVEHLSTIGTAAGWDFFEPDSVTRGPLLIEKLTQVILANQYDIVIIDPLMEAYPVKDENDNALANAQILAFRRLARSTNTAIVVVHNSGLRKDKRNPKFLGRGATARVDRADVAINFTWRSATERILTVVKARGANLGDRITLRFASELGYELVDSSSPSQSAIATLQTETVELVKKEIGEGRFEVERKTLMERLSVEKDSSREQALDRALSKNVVSGALRKVRKGIYALPLVTAGASGPVVPDDAGCAEERAGAPSADGEPEAASQQLGALDDQLNVPCLVEAAAA